MNLYSANGIRTYQPLYHLLLERHGIRLGHRSPPVVSHSEADLAFEWLEKAVEYHDLFLVAVAGHPMLSKIHSEPRWLPFLRKHGMAPEQLATIKFELKLPQ
jgi:hypothetical protein